MHSYCSQKYEIVSFRDPVSQDQVAMILPPAPQIRTWLLAVLIFHSTQIVQLIDIRIQDIHIFVP